MIASALIDTGGILAQRESLSVILTVDHNDFETYRINGRRRFRIVPPRGAGA